MDARSKSEVDDGMRRVLIVDDDQDFAASLMDLLRPHGYSLTAVENAAQAVNACGEFNPQVALVDLRLGQSSGSDLIGRLHELDSELLCIMVTAYAEIDSAIEALKQGAYDYLRKPLDGAELLATLDRTFEKLDLQQDHRRTEVERQVLEDQLRHAQKMEAIGRLAGGIAHDFNNLLVVILACSELLQIEAQSEAPRRKKLLDGLEQIEQAGHRASALTRQLLAFSRQQVVKPEVFDPNEAIGSVEMMLRRVIGEDVHLTVALGSSLKPVRMDRGQLEQVIMNLAVNARDALPGGGSIQIRTDLVELDRAALEPYPDSHPGPHDIITVTDNGCGMDAATIERVFEPFYTTKPMGQGTGLGLSTVYGIVRQAGGHVEIESEPNVGTTFKVCLPTVDSPVVALESTSREDVAASGSETVLVCEDEDSVRDVICQILRRNGYKVLEAASGAQALETAARHDGPVHLLLTDVILPDQTGPDVAEVLRRTLPQLRVLCCSGYTGSALAQRTGFVEGINLLQKPFTTRTLLKRVRDTLAGKPAD